MYTTFIAVLVILAHGIVALGHVIVDSSDVGVHKCEFQGHLGQQEVRLYVFLSACVRPSSPIAASPNTAPTNLNSHTDARIDPNRLLHRAKDNSNYHSNSNTNHLHNHNNTSNGNAVPRPGISRRHLIASSSTAPLASHTTTAAATSSQQAVPPVPLPNFFLTGTAFMTVVGEPVTTTQVQQPLTTLLWAAAAPAEYYPWVINATGNSTTDGTATTTAAATGGTDKAGDATGVSEAASETTDWSSDGGGVGGGWRLSQQDASAVLAMAAKRLTHGTEAVFQLRVLRSSKTYDIRLSYRDPAHWTSNPSLLREPGRLMARIHLDAEDFLQLAAGSDPGSVSLGSTHPPADIFELSATGFHGTCGYSPSKDRRLTKSVYDSKTPPPGPITAATKLGNVLPRQPYGTPTCAWLHPDRVAYDASLAEFWSRTHGPSSVAAAAAAAAANEESGRERRGRRRRRKKKKARRRRGRSLQPPPPPPPPPVGLRPVPIYMILSPYFSLTPYDFATLLLHHMRYHEALGVHRYIVYVEEGEEELAADGRLNDVIATGRLQLVRWRDLPVVYLPGTNVRHPYASQILSYNHALLSMWHEAALVAVADLDEYLMTSQAMGLEQIMYTCSPHGRYPPGVLWVPRRAAVCSSCWAAAVRKTQSSAAPLTNTTSQALQRLAERHLRNTTLAATATALERSVWLTDTKQQQHQHHPLQYYRHWSNGWHHKSLSYSHLVSYLGVHLSYSSVPSRRPHTISRSGCAVWAHLTTQLGPRRQPLVSGLTSPVPPPSPPTPPPPTTTTTTLEQRTAQQQQQQQDPNALLPESEAAGLRFDSVTERDGPAGGAEQRGKEGEGKEDEGMETTDDDYDYEDEEGGQETRVSQLEHRYVWAVERVLGRQLPLTQYWGQGNV